MPVLQNLRVLILSKNFIDTIENLDSLPNLDVLDLNDNRILKIENLSALKKLRILNLSNNLLEIKAEKSDHVTHTESMKIKS